MGDMIDQSDWLEWLRDDAPYQTCGSCGRKTWDTDEFNQTCGMTQPSGVPCGGKFGPRITHGD